MARRNQAGNTLALVLIVLVALPLIAIMKLFTSFGPLATILAALGVFGLIIGVQIQKRAARVSYLRTKYGDEQIVQKILHRNFWSGQTSEQLRDSLGSPLAIDNALLKTRKREVWKYNQRGKNRFGLRITLDDDHVVGWDQK